MQTPYLIRLALTLTLLMCAATHAAELTLPLRLPVAILQESLQSALGLNKDTTTEIFRQGDCRFVELNGLNLKTANGHVHLTSRANVKFGPEWFGSCVGAVGFNGVAEFELEPYVTPEHLLRYRLLNTQLLDEHGNKILAAGLIWKLVANIMQPKLETYQIDLRPPRGEITDVLRNFVSQSQAEALDKILSTIRIDPLTVSKDELRVPLALDIPDSYMRQTQALPFSAETPLSADELADFERTSQAWDAFLVYIIRNLGLGTQDDAIRIRLLEILLNSRYQITAILSGESDEMSADPTRELFTTTWNDLHALIAEAGERGLLRGNLLSYLSFLTAGDALFLLDSTAPGLGMEISENGLRRLARAMRPLDKADPLEFDWSLDPFLQDLFDIGSPEAAPEPGARLPAWLDLLIPAAYAEVIPDNTEPLAAQLKNWLPKPDELDRYHAVVTALLEQTRASEKNKKISKSDAEALQFLLPTTALIESCWRQYMQGPSGVTYLRSPSGSVGMMQVNPRVWRGIFDAQKLKADASYNVAAGTHILLHYLRLYARPIAERSGRANDLPRATYAAYNAGPRAATRILKTSRKSRTRLIDEKFWGLYQGLSEGGVVDLQTCKVVPPASS